MSTEPGRLINGLGKGTASAVPPRANKDAGFSPGGSRRFIPLVHYEIASNVRLCTWNGVVLWVRDNLDNTRRIKQECASKRLPIRLIRVAGESENDMSVHWKRWIGYFSLAVLLTLLSINLGWATEKTPDAGAGLRHIIPCWTGGPLKPDFGLSGETPDQWRTIHHERCRQALEKGAITRTT